MRTLFFIQEFGVAKNVERTWHWQCCLCHKHILCLSSRTTMTSARIPEEDAYYRTQNIVYFLTHSIAAAYIICRSQLCHGRSQDETKSINIPITSPDCSSSVATIKLSSFEVFCKKIRGMLRWQQIVTKCDPLVAASCIKFPLLATTPTRYLKWRIEYNFIVYRLVH